jgi:poly(A) polymerase
MPTTYCDQQHTINRDAVDKDALYVIHRLRQAGYSAYLVGGGVRDLLLGLSPKDFDISTSARPEQIKKLFGRQCLLIGRRFRLAHIRFGHKVLEVSTYRAGEMKDDLIVHDNEWGTEEQDVLRRDFTINGLFYDPETHSVIDHVGGWQDLIDKRLRSIGEPEVRFRQDPVRMIRLLKFQARFNFQIAEKDLEALRECRMELLKSSSARLLEEWLRMMESKAIAPFTRLMMQHELLPILFPKLSKELAGPKGPEMLRFLEACDHENKKAANYPIERPVLVAALLYPLLEESLRSEQKNSTSPLVFPEILSITDHVIREHLVTSFSHFPKRITILAGFALSQQLRITPLAASKQHPARLFRSHDFPLALRLLKLRSMVYPALKETYVTWRELYRKFLDSDDHHKVSHPSPNRHRRRRGPRGRS